MAGPCVVVASTGERRERLVEALEAAGCMVRAATTATGALAQLSTGSCDCLISERTLPGDDGLALRAAAQQVAPSLPVVIVDDAEADRTASVATDCVRLDGDGSVDRLVAAVYDNHSQSDEEPIDTDEEPIDTDEGTTDTGEEPTDDACRRFRTRIDGLFGSLSGGLFALTDRTEVERRVCEMIAAEPGYVAAWICHADGDGLDPNGPESRPVDGAVRLSAAAGLPVSAPTTIPPKDLPAVVEEAINTGEPRRPSESIEGLLAPEAEARWLLVVPLQYGGQHAGVLGLCGVDAFEPWERTVGVAVGSLIALGFRAVELTRALTADHVTELRIDLRDESCQLARIAAVLSEPVERCGAIDTGSERELYLTTEAAVDPARLRSLSFVERVRVVGETDAGVTLSVSVSAVVPDESLAELGAVVTGAAATADGATIRVELPPQQAVRPLLDRLRSEYDTVDLRGRTERTRRERHPTEFAAIVDQRLTDRQQAALRAAWHNGYFEWPRPVDGGEIAATMDITRQTFHQHLRAAERKLVAAYVDAA